MLLSCRRDDVLARLDNVEASGLDPKTYALVRLGALLVLDAAPVSSAGA
jgi:hypothetical protein